MKHSNKEDQNRREKSSGPEYQSARINSRRTLNGFKYIDSKDISGIIRENGTNNQTNKEYSPPEFQQDFKKSSIVASYPKKIQLNASQTVTQFPSIIGQDNCISTQKAEGSIEYGRENMKDYLKKLSSSQQSISIDLKQQFASPKPSNKFILSLPTTSHSNNLTFSNLNSKQSQEHLFFSQSKMAQNSNSNIFYNTLYSKGFGKNKLSTTLSSNSYERFPKNKSCLNPNNNSQNVRVPKTTGYLDISGEVKETQKINNSYIKILPSSKTIASDSLGIIKSEQSINITKERINQYQSQLQQSHQQLPSILDASSPILSAGRADLMNQLSKKTSENFYGKLIQSALSTEIFYNPQKEGIDKNSSQSFHKYIIENNHATPYDTNLNSIKSKLSVHLLQLIKSDLYGKKDDNLEKSSDFDQTDWKFKKIAFPNQQHYENKLEQLWNNIRHQRETNEKTENKLFTQVSNQDHIVVHASQNKDLANLGERRDVMGLALWYEDMISLLKKEKINQEKPNYSKTLNDLQVIHQACMEEIIRQVSIHCVERGQLLKRVWQNLMNLLNEAFTQQQEEEVFFQKKVIKEITQIQSDCEQKIDFYIPFINDLQSDLQKKEALNERIALEFRYLKNKNNMLEKMLSEAKGELRQFKDDYNLLAKQLDELKILNSTAQIKHVEEKQKIVNRFADQLALIAEESQKRQRRFSEKMKLEMEDLRNIEADYESQERQIDTQFQLRQADIDEIEERAQKREFNIKQPTKEIKKSRDYYAERLRGTPSVSAHSDQNNNMEIEGIDGIRLVLTSVAVQVEDDLKETDDKETSTFALVNYFNQAAQTEGFPPEQQNESQQTPSEWMAKSNDIYDSSDDYDSDTSEKHEKPFKLNKVKEGKTVADQLADTTLHKYLQAAAQSETLNHFDESHMQIEPSDKIIVPKARRNSQNTPISRSSSKMFSDRILKTPKVVHQSLESTLGNKIEGDIQDLKTLQDSKMKFIHDVIQKIIKFDLLKENSVLNQRTLLTFLEDSLSFEQEESERLKNIRAECKHHLIQSVKQRLDISERLAEIEETKKNLDFGNSLYSRLKADYQKISDQLNTSNSNNGVRKQFQNNKSSNASALLNDKFRKSFSSFQKIPQAEDSSDEDDELEENQKGLESPTSTSLTRIHLIDQNSSESKVEVKIDLNTSISPQSSAQNITPKKTGEDLKSKFKSKFSVAVNAVIKDKRESRIEIQTSQNINEQDRAAVNENFIYQQILMQKKQAQDLFSLDRYTKLRLRKRYGNQSSPNVDAASVFFRIYAMKIMSERGKKVKGVVFTEGNMRRYISMVYGEKMKQIKAGDRSNPLHNVTYDFFLNKFGFKKMAEKNLKQFLRSLQYHYHIDKVKGFLRFYGIDHAMNYDDYDFNFFAECLIQLEDNNLPLIYSQFNLTPIQKILEILFKTFDNKIQLRVLNRIRQEIESMRYVSSEPALKTKNVIDLDLGLECLISAKLEEKKVIILALRPVYLAGDVDRDEVIGREEFMMLGRNIEINKGIVLLTQFYSLNTDLIDEITGEKTMSFQQFALISVQNELFSTERTSNFLQTVEDWDEIKNVQILKSKWIQKKDVIRLRLVKAGAYRNFYRLMVKRIDDYFEEEEKIAQQQLQQFQLQLQQQQSLQQIKLPIEKDLVSKSSSHLSHTSIPSNEDSSAIFQLPSQKSLALPLQSLNQKAEKPYSEDQRIVFLIYRLLDEESKREIVQQEIENLLPKELFCFGDIMIHLAQENKLPLPINKKMNIFEPSSSS